MVSHSGGKMPCTRNILFVPSHNILLYMTQHIKRQQNIIENRFLEVENLRHSSIITASRTWPWGGGIVFRREKASKSGIGILAEKRDNSSLFT
jgi:hypothetical protein